MAEYHKYVFNDRTRKFIGKFEEMYRAESERGFDSWHQDDLRDLEKRICFNILDQYKWDRILDVGCGKGMFTQLLKKNNNYVLGIDISETALCTAAARCPDIEFRHTDVRSSGNVEAVAGELVDLVVCLQTLSYLENWRELLRTFAHIGRHILIALFIPENPIGCVRSFSELHQIFLKHFDILEDIRMLNRNKIILFGKSRKLTE